jgi:hypothetical protein
MDVMDFQKMLCWYDVLRYYPFFFTITDDEKDGRIDWNLEYNTRLWKWYLDHHPVEKNVSLA